MEYDIKTIPLNRLPVTMRGLEFPLCSSCVNPDCSHPIREREVSILGCTQKLRLYVSGTSVFQVVACSGYTQDPDV